MAAPCPGKTIFVMGFSFRFPLRFFPTLVLISILWNIVPSRAPSLEIGFLRLSSRVFPFTSEPAFSFVIAFPSPPSAHLHCLSFSLSHTHLAPSKTPLHRPSSVCTRNTNSKARRLQDTFVFPTWTPHNRAVKNFPRSCVCSTGRPPHGIRSN